jgi:hypothetical protein
VNRTEHCTQEPSETTGLLALLCAFRCYAETGACTVASCAGRGASAIVLAAALGLALLGAASAFAASEPPTIEGLGCGRQGPTTQTTISVGASIETSSSEAASWSFEYATVEAGPWSPIPGGTGSVPAGTDPVGGTDAEASLTGLKPETAYYVRILATNGSGTVSKNYVCATTPLHPRIERGNRPSVTATTAHIVANVIPDNFETNWRVESATSEGGPWTVVTGGTVLQAEADEKYHLIKGELTGLSPSTTYYVRIFAGNGHPPDQTEVFSFETAGPPILATFPTHAIEGEDMRALGSVVPHGFDSHYHFEYVSQRHFAGEGFANASTTPEQDAGGGVEEQNTGQFATRLVGADLPGLQAGETYHYRIVASNEKGTVDGAEQTLTAPVPGRLEAGEAQEQPSPCPNEDFRTGPSAHLPDCRAYELVTPPDKGGAQDIYNYGSADSISLIGEDGQYVVVHTVAKWGASAGSYETDYLFSRTSDGWQMRSTVPQPAAGNETYAAQIFSPDLTQVAILAYTENTLGPLGHSAQEGFQVGPPGGPYVEAASSPFDENTELYQAQDEWVGGSADGSKHILRTADRELLGHATGTIGATAYDLYEFSARTGLRQLNVKSGDAPIGACGAVLPYGDETYAGIEGGTEGATQSGVERSNLATSHAVSTDGSRVFFEAVPGANCSEPSHLYMRVNGEETVDIGTYLFRGANQQGSRLLLEKLNGETHEFFLYDSEAQAATYLFSMREAPEHAIVSDDLAAFYFVTQQQLTPEAPKPSTGIAGGQSLYRYDIATRTLRFVAQSLFTAGTQDSELSTPPRRSLSLLLYAGNGWWDGFPQRTGIPL